MNRFDQVDYSALQVPDAIEAWTFDAILAARMQAYLGEWEAARALDPTLPAYDVDALETDPAKRLQRVDGYRESLIRQRINEAIRATYLASAIDNDLTTRAAEYLTARAAGELDDALRSRAQLAWENLSIGGSYGGYAYRARSVAPVDIADVAVWGYEASDATLFGAKALADMRKGEVRVALLGAGANGLLPSSLIDRVQAALSVRDGRKVNDFINVVQATRTNYVVDARLVLKRNSAPATIVDTARIRTKAYAAAARLIGVPATRGGFLAAMMAAAPGLVTDVELFSPVAAIGGGPCEAPLMSGLAIDWRWE